jgi:pimeloyl-ACP methyl ester carboxylesterase
MSEPLVVLLHGWPGLSSDYDEVRARLHDIACVVPEIVGFGEGFHEPLPAGSASAGAHADRVLAALPGDAPLLVVGYDIGSRIAQAMLRAAPHRFVGAVLTPGYPGIGARSSEPGRAGVFWYQHFHRTPLAAELIDGRPDAVRAYVRHLTTAWAADDRIASGARFDEIVDAYSRPGAFAASIAWYRDNVGYTEGSRIDVPTTMLWPETDPLFPLEWADELDAWFTDIEVRPVPSGHFVPLEAPDAVADAIRGRLKGR